MFKKITKNIKIAKKHINYKLPYEIWRLSIFLGSSRTKLMASNIVVPQLLLKDIKNNKKISHVTILVAAVIMRNKLRQGRPKQ